MPKLVIGTTGPTIFNSEIQAMIETYYKATPLYITQNGTEDLKWVMENIDALILAGGNDIHPMTYGQPVTHGDGLSKFDLMRDKRELFLIDACIKAGKPILGICRGLQIICVRYGFGFYANIGGDIAHSPGEIKLNIPKGEALHFIECLHEFKDKYFEESQPVLSFHHQGVAVPRTYVNDHNGINIVAIADTDTNSKDNKEIVEIAESQKLQIIACQCHPEVDYMYGNLVSNKVLERFKEFLA